MSVLLSDQRRDVALDTAGAEANDDHGDDETTQGDAICDGDRQGGQDENDHADEVDDGEVEDCPVLAEVLIGDDGADDGSDIAPELEEVGEARGGLLAQADGARQSARVVVGVLDVVLERAGEAVIGEALAQLDGRDQEGGPGQLVGDSAERLLVTLGWFLVVVGVDAQAVVLFGLGFRDPTLALLAIRLSRVRLTCPRDTCMRKEEAYHVTRHASTRFGPGVMESSGDALACDHIVDELIRSSVGRRSSNRQERGKGVVGSAPGASIGGSHAQSIGG